LPSIFGCNIWFIVFNIQQNEKCHLLIEHETQKLKELDEEHSQELKDWREKLRPRKKVFSTSFATLSFQVDHAAQSLGVSKQAVKKIYEILFKFI